MTLTDLLPHLSKVKRSGSGYTASCPCHNDKTPSLSINERDGKLLVHCFGCGAGLPDVLDALGLTREAPADKLLLQYSPGSMPLRPLRHSSPSR